MNDQHIGDNELRWGFASTGFVAQNFAHSVANMQSKNHVFQAVGARDLNAARHFAERFSCRAYYGSYDELCQDPKVNIVYVGTINITHKEICLKAIQAGKHVLCEKPACLSLNDLDEVLLAARSKNVFFMEGIWTRFFPAVQKLKKEIDNGAIGELKHLTSFFLAGSKDMERIKNKSLGGGGLLDIGIYPIQLACLFFDHETPLDITCRGHMMATGVDECATIVLLFSRQRTATISVSTNCALYGKTILVGDRGIAEIPEYSWCPTDYIINGTNYHEPLPSEFWPISDFKNAAGLRYEAEAVRLAISKGLIEEPSMTHENSRLVMKIIDEAHKQLGYTK